MDPTIFALANGDPDAEALLTAAVEQTLSNEDLDRFLLRHASPAVFAACIEHAMYAYMMLEHYVAKRVLFGDDEQSVPGWTQEELDGEIVGFLSKLRQRAVAA